MEDFYAEDRPPSLYGRRLWGRQERSPAVRNIDRDRDSGLLMFRSVSSHDLAEGRC